MTLPHPSGDKHYSRRRPELVRRGPDAPGAKLSKEQITALYDDLQAPDANKANLAEKYGVSRITIWRHARARETG